MVTKSNRDQRQIGGPVRCHSRWYLCYIRSLGSYGYTPRSDYGNCQIGSPFIVTMNSNCFRSVNL